MLTMKLEEPFLPEKIRVEEIEGSPLSGQEELVDILMVEFKNLSEVRIISKE